MDWLLYEKEAESEGYQAVCGVDEAGRGPLAGPVYAAAVILPTDTIIDGVNDSKKLTEKKREALFPIICERAVSYCVASASEAEIDEMNILNATFLARVIEETRRSGHVFKEHVGERNPMIKKKGTAGDFIPRKMMDRQVVDQFMQRLISSYTPECAWKGSVQ